MHTTLKQDRDVKQITNVVYFIFGSIAAAIAALITDHPILNGWFFGAVTAFSLVMYLLALLCCSKIAASKLFQSSYVLPVWFCRILRGTALLLPLLAIVTASFYLCAMCETSLFIDRLEYLDKKHRPADVRKEAISWVSQHRDSGYSWYKLAAFYQRKGQFDLALNAANEHVRLHNWEKSAHTQRNQILASLAHKPAQPVPQKRRHGFLDATSVAILLPTLVLLALIIAAAHKNGLFPWQKGKAALTN